MCESVGIAIKRSWLRLADGWASCHYRGVAERMARAEMIMCKREKSMLSVTHLRLLRDMSPDVVIFFSDEISRLWSDPSRDQLTGQITTYNHMSVPQTTYGHAFAVMYHSSPRHNSVT